jgi:hypothetical protein
MDGGFEVTSFYPLENIYAAPDLDGSKNTRWLRFFRYYGYNVQASNIASCCKMVAPGAASALDAPAEAQVFFEPADQPPAAPFRGGSLPSPDAAPVDPAFATVTYGPGVIAAPPSSTDSVTSPDSRPPDTQR